MTPELFFLILQTISAIVGIGSLAVAALSNHGSKRRDVAELVFFVCIILTFFFFLGVMIN